MGEADPFYSNQHLLVFPLDMTLAMAWYVRQHSDEVALATHLQFGTVRAAHHPKMPTEYNRNCVVSHNAFFEQYKHTTKSTETSGSMVKEPGSSNVMFPAVKYAGVNRFMWQQFCFNSTNIPHIPHFCTETDTQAVFQVAELFEDALLRWCYDQIQKEQYQFNLIFGPSYPSAFGTSAKTEVQLVTQLLVRLMCRMHIAMSHMSLTGYEAEIVLGPGWSAKQILENDTFRDACRFWGIRPSTQSRTAWVHDAPHWFIRDKNNVDDFAFELGTVVCYMVFSRGKTPLTEEHRSHIARITVKVPNEDGRDAYVVFRFDGIDGEKKQSKSTEQQDTSNTNTNVVCYMMTQQSANRPNKVQLYKAMPIQPVIENTFTPGVFLPGRDTHVLTEGPVTYSKILSTITGDTLCVHFLTPDNDEGWFECIGIVCSYGGTTTFGHHANSRSPHSGHCDATTCWFYVAKDGQFVRYQLEET